MTRYRWLALGPSEGWHADELRRAAKDRDGELVYATYESLAASVDGEGAGASRCSAGALTDFDAVLCRTMPAGTLEQITFRLAVLHAAESAGVVIVNRPRTLETAIDKYATLVRVASLGYGVPATEVVQSRGEAMAAFDSLGGDVVVKPIFGGEGRGVMRVTDRQLAWVTFSTLEQLGAAIYVQRFVPPGGRDTRMLVIGREILGIRRTNPRDFRTNVAGGGHCQPVVLSESSRAMARTIADSMSLSIGSVDLLDTLDDSPVVVEVNAVPGWKGAQASLSIDIAGLMIDTLSMATTWKGAA